MLGQSEDHMCRSTDYANGTLELKLVVTKQKSPAFVPSRLWSKRFERTKQCKQVKTTSPRGYFHAPLFEYYFGLLDHF